MAVSDQKFNRQLKFLLTAKSIFMKPYLILSCVAIQCEVCVVLYGLPSFLSEEKKLYVFYLN